VSVEPYWISKTVVIDWSLKKLDGTAAAGATVAGTFTKPTGATTAGTVTEVGAAADGGRLYRITVDPDLAGQWAFRLTATGTADSAEGGTFYVRPDEVGTAANTYDPATDRGRVRLLIPDTDVHDPARVIFSDAEIDALLALENANVRLAAAAGLDAIASNEALVSKKIKSQDMSTDGPAVAKELRERATELRRQVAEGDADDTGGFHIVEYDPYAWVTAAELAE
jgi:hypothetical protein